MVGRCGGSMVGVCGGSMVGGCGGTMVGECGGSMVGRCGSLMVGGCGGSMVGRCGSSMAVGCGGSKIVGVGWLIDSAPDFLHGLQSRVRIPHLPYTHITAFQLGDQRRGWHGKRMCKQRPQQPFGCKEVQFYHDFQFFLDIGTAETGPAYVHSDLCSLESSAPLRSITLHISNQ